ncbi:class I SAM-dependent methyltransferase [Marinibaculum pumilum]|uniref:Class I SAM-dependent methyltransferase n=1 Tax=Marinibaculum pumilum TaxID=1766165 RepID=A0ABV7KWF4_9PROT
MTEVIDLSASRKAQDHAGTDLWTRLLLRLARHVRCGAIRLTLPGGQTVQVSGERAGPQAELTIRRTRFARRLLLGGATGVGAAYIDGDFQSPDLAALVEWAVSNEDLARSALQAVPPLRLAGRALQALRRNSRRGSRRNIAFHYDLGNEFYAQWLDPTMTYSAACFDSPRDDLQTAQLNKYRRIAEMAGLQPGDRVLEIGTGWGGFACFAAREFGARVTTVTISAAQADYAAARVREEGLGDRVEVALRDYRDVTGSYERIVSIEMLEAVGADYWPVFFGRLHALLVPGGVAALQSILIEDRHYPAYSRRQDFIQRYIFPGGMLPCPSALQRETARAGLRLTADERFGADYAQTLRLWRHRFLDAWPVIERQGFDPGFRRMWEFYLAYCEGGFRSGRIDVAHLRLQKD